MPLNWGIEAKKWQLAMRTLQPLSFSQSLKAVLAGLSTGLITPNRIGNFIGRTYHLKNEVKTKATFLTFLTNLAQYLTTISVGLVGLFFISTQKVGVNLGYLSGVGIIVLGCAIGCYFKPAVIYIKKLHKWYPSKILEGIKHVKEAPNEQKRIILFLSYLRYAVFVFQYALILYAFAKGHSFTVLIIHITVVYLIMTVTPALFFGKLIVREGAALLVFSALSISTPAILISGFVLWFINLALPSLIGARFLFAKK